VLKQPSITAPLRWRAELPATPVEAPPAETPPPLVTPLPLAPPEPDVEAVVPVTPEPLGPDVVVLGPPVPDPVAPVEAPAVPGVVWSDEQAAAPQKKATQRKWRFIASPRCRPEEGVNRKQLS